MDSLMTTESENLADSNSTAMQFDLNESMDSLMTIESENLADINSTAMQFDLDESMDSLITEYENLADSNSTALQFDLNESVDSLMTTESENLADSNTTALQFDLEMTISVSMVENGSRPGQSEVSFSNREKNETFSRKKEVNASSLSGVKRPRDNEKPPLVHFTYRSLTRESKQELEKLLEQWSQWQSQWLPWLKHKKLVLEPGETTYIRALRIGLESPSIVMEIPQLRDIMMTIIEHASQCNPTEDNPCPYSTCRIMKEKFVHIRECKVRATGDCIHCMRVWYTLYWHSKCCTDSHCKVPHCMDIKDWSMRRR